ncbi:MAG: hypothetical protein EOO62_31840 [Hymenobacter sp.]|nr:MAG: hypothetical protein EOO62_31840 [Hymenobacter sp.]
MRNATFFRRFTLAASFLLVVGTAQQALAQDSGGPTPTPQAPDPTAVPLDGGASLLLAGSVAYGWRKLRQRRRK